MLVWRRSLPKVETQVGPPEAERRIPRDFKTLGKRAKWLTRRSEVEDILPSVDCDLERLLHVRVNGPAIKPNLSRREITNQLKLLEYQLNGKPEICLLNSLTISYLRRNTDHAAKARRLFLRIWAEHGDFVAKKLNTRWVLSTVQTFAEHGENEQQRQIGMAGFIYGTLIRASEVERGYQKLEPDAIYPTKMARMDNRFRHLGGYPVGGTDMLFNLNAVMVGLAATDDAAGRVLFELLRRIRAGDTLFSRMDKTRIEHDIHADFRNTGQRLR